MERMMEEAGHTRGNRSMTRSARQRVNRNARRLVTYLILCEVDLVLRKRVDALLRTNIPIDAATLRIWVANRPQIEVGSGIVSVTIESGLTDVNWEYAAELVNRKMYV